jgi:hypothetical protein
MGLAAARAVHLVEGFRDATGKVRHRVVAKLGRRDRLKASDALDNLAAAFTRLDPLPGRFLCGALPLLIPVLRRLDVIGIVDRACPMRGRAHPTHGEVISALVANRLTSPCPPYDVQRECWRSPSPVRIGCVCGWST